MGRSGKQILKNLIFQAGTVLPEHVRELIENALYEEKDTKARERLKILLENARIAEEEKRPICQDTGVVNIFLELPEGCTLPEGFKEACDSAVEEVYKEAGFRFSTVNPPVGIRKNTFDNKPAFVKVIPVPAYKNVKISVMLKGAGSENSSFLLMLKPTLDEEEVIRIIAEEIGRKAPLSCPPVIAGVSLGGTPDSAMLNAKLALFDAGLYQTEIGNKIKEIVNRAGVGPFGLGGRTTALQVCVRTEPTHMASLPVAVSMSCHALRYASAEINADDWKSLSFEEHAEWI